MDVREKTESEKRLIDYYYLAEKIECPGEPLVYWDDIEAAPTVDAVEVVRCKDCKHRHSDSWCEYVDDDDNFYCARGERKDRGDSDEAD